MPLVVSQPFPARQRLAKKRIKRNVYGSEFPYPRRVKLVKIPKGRLIRLMTCAWCGQWYRMDVMGSLGCNGAHEREARRIQRKMRTGWL